MAASPCFCEPTQARVPSGEIVPLWTWGAATSPVTLSVAVSMMSARLEPKPDTSTFRPSRDMASPWGLTPTSMDATTLSVAVSITLTVDAPSLLT